MADDAVDGRQIRADAALMAAVVAGERDAFARLVAKEAPRLVRFATGLLDNDAEAEEIAQEALLRLWRQAPDWRPVARIGTWLHQVTYRLAIDLLRRRRPMVEMEEIVDLIVDPAPLPEEALADGQRLENLRQALGGLPERQRAAILLAYHQDLGQREAAFAMGISEEAYESLLARARRRLRHAAAAWMAAEMPEGGTPT
jgi:RNA polymerase sigma-70 factor, ECF subfamily